MKDANTHKVAIAIGSNVGDPQDNIKQSLAYLSEFIDGLNCASLYQSAPMYETNQGVFVNTVVVGNTTLKPLTLLANLKEIEVIMGRMKTMRNGPRLIDLDIVLYDDQIIRLDALSVPHPRMSERPFVMIPLNELMPNYEHPVFKKSINDMTLNLKYDANDLIKL